MADAMFDKLIGYGVQPGRVGILDSAPESRPVSLTGWYGITPREGMRRPHTRGEHHMLTLTIHEVPPLPNPCLWCREAERTGTPTPCEVLYPHTPHLDYTGAEPLVIHLEGGPA